MNSYTSNDLSGVAIVGMAGRFPGASTVDEFWNNLIAGRESITHFSPESISPVVSAEVRRHPRYVRARGVIDAADRFDAGFFGIPPREALMMDPQQRIFLELCWNALEHAGVDPERFAGSVGVYAGVSNNSYRKLLESRSDLVQAAGEFAVMLANEKDYVATRVAHRLNLTGPALSIHTACSTSLVAVAQAWYALMSWQCDMALAGGINIVVPQESGYVPVEGGMESEDGHCRPFDARANGTLFSSGGAVVALKRLSEAVEQGDMIWAVIRGVGINNDGGDKASFTGPSVRGQAAVIRQALTIAGADARSIGYVEAHGTGTHLGDPIEVEALTRAFREDTDENQFCWLGSAKSNLGHLVAGAGVTGLIKAALALHHGRIPPTLHYEIPNPEIDFGSTPFKVANAAILWPHGAVPRRAGVSSFGVGGTNAHVVLEEAPSRGVSAHARPVTLLTLSARDEQALTRRASELAVALQDRNDDELADIGYTLAVGRRPMPTRGSVVARNIVEARERLALLAARNASSPPRLVFLFPGQGSQHPNMAASLVDTEPVFRDAFDRCCALASERLGCDLRKLILPGTQLRRTDESVLTETRYTQPALFAVEYALARLWESWGYRPVSMIGHSIGEYVAACLAGVFPLEVAIALVVARGKAMFACQPGSMLAVHAGEAEVALRLPACVEIAALNARDLTVVAGTSSGIDRFAEVLSRENIRTTGLRVSHAFHSSLMDAALPALQLAFDGLKLAPPQQEFYSSLTGAPISAKQATSSDYWCQQLRSPVRFLDAVRHALSAGPTLFIEVGPGQTLTALTRSSLEGRGKVMASLSSPGRPDEEPDQLFRALGECWSLGLEPDWTEFYAGSPRRRCPLPGYPFRGERYWIDASPASHTSSALAGGPTVQEEPATVARASVSPVDAAAPRTARFVEELIDLFETLTGERIQRSQTNTSFLDLGLDSLLLTQATLEVERRYGLKLKFRRLMQDLNSIEKLSAQLDSTIPVTTPPPPANLSPTAIVPAVAAASLPGLANGTLENSALAQLIQSQIALMDQQARLLQVLAGTAQAPPQAPAQVSQAPVPDSRAASLEERPFGASPRIATQQKTEFTPAQRSWVDAFTCRYTSRTAKSKAFSQENRQLMADPRVVTGFNPLWKELTYPIVVDRSKGARLWDLDGNEYIDLLNGFGSNFFGYQADFIVEAVEAQLRAGIEIGPQHPLTADVAKLVREMTGMPRVAFCNTGSEAVMGAMRLARTVTGRKAIVIFKDSYHGIFDEVIVRGSRNLRSISASPGIPASAVENVLVLDYGSDEALQVIRDRAGELAAVMIEPVQGRNMTQQPRRFVEELRKICDAAGCALIFDEVVTGFRIAPGGAQEFYGVRADIATYGKVIGGGLPFAAIAGEGRWMDAMDGGNWQFGDESYPEIGVTYFAGTFMRHPLALAAAKAALTYVKECGPRLQREVNSRTTALVERLNGIFEHRRAPVSAVSFSSLWRLRVDEDQPFASLLYYAMRERGLHVYEQFNCFLTEAHQEAEIDAIVARIESALEELMRTGVLTLRTAVPGSATAHVDRKTETPSQGEPDRPGSGRLPIEVPLTEGQMEKWLACQYGTQANIAFNEGFVLTLDGSLNHRALESAVSIVIQRHEAFALSFLPDGSGQRLNPGRELTLPIVDLSGDTCEERFSSYCADATRRPFDLTVAPLARIELLHIGPERHALLVVAHHLIFDGWSAAVFLDEIARAYEALANNLEIVLEPADSYRAYALAERERSSGPDVGRQIDYWKRVYSMLPDVATLPADYREAAGPDFAADTVRHELPRQLVEALKREARQCSVTFYSLLLASFGVLVSRLSGQRDFAVGIPFAAQPLSGARNLIGDGVNTLPVRLTVEPDTTFLELAAATHGSLLDAAENSDLTLNTLLRELKLPRDPNRRPLTEFVFNLNPRVPELYFPGLRYNLHECAKSALAWDLFFNLTDTGDGMALDIHYRSGLFDVSTIRRWIGHYETLLEAVAGGRDKRVASLPLLNADDRRRVLMDWNETTRVYDRGRAIPSLISAEAAKSASRIAIECGNQSLTYGEIDNRSDDLARILQARGTTRGELIGVCMSRRAETLVALLGILKSGAAYVPLDPSFPEEQLRYMADHAGIRHVLTWKHEEVPLSLTHGREVLPVAELDSFSVPKIPLPAVSGDDLAYVLYTSGSTGEPKGVRILHRNLVNFLSSMQRCPGIAVDEVLCAVTTLSFDIAGLELFLPLTVGAKVVLATEREQRDSDALASLVRRRGATMLQTTPSLLRMLVEGERIESIRGLKLLVGGEALPLDLIAAVLPRCRELWNMYGPTETTIWSTMQRITSVEDPLPLGTPIDNTRIYVLDSERQPVPPGVTGEIWIGGDGVGDGYLSRPDLTAERFVTDPFAGDQSRMYRSGDLGSLRGGLLYFHGRADDQIKLRGHRIEPGAIETVAMRQAGVRDAVVVAREFSKGDVRLTLYVVPHAGFSLTDEVLSGHLREQLPAYMVPRYIEFLDALPKTPNGKVDRKALPLPGKALYRNAGVQTVEKASFEGNRSTDMTSTERRLSAIWQKILDVGEVALDDNFFDLGGHSLLAVRVTTEIEKTFGRHLPLSAFFQMPTVRQLGKLLSDNVSLRGWSSLVPIQERGSKPPFFWAHGEASDALLSRYFDADQPLYGLMHQSKDGNPARFTRVEDIAAHYLSEIRSVQPHGPYFFGGFCFGGLVAFEMAQQLKSQNEEVGLLVLLAPSTPKNMLFPSLLRPRNENQVSPDEERFRDEVSRHLRTLAELEYGEKRSYITKRIGSRAMELMLPARKVARKVAWKIYMKLGYRVPVSLRGPYILDVYFKAIDQYAPRPYNGTAVFFQEQDPFHDSAAEWANLLQLSVYQIPGDHSVLTKEPCAQLWAEQLQVLLMQAQGIEFRGQTTLAPNSEVRI